MSKKLMCILFLAFPTILIQTEGCRKEKEPKIYNVEQYVKDWMFFDTGTWWVYQELKSGDMDSQYVTESRIFYYESKPGKNDEYPKEQSIEVYNSSGFFYNLASPLGSSNIKKIRYNMGSEKGSTYLLFKPLDVGSSPPQASAKIISIEPNYQLDSIRNDTLLTLLDKEDYSENSDSVEYKVFKGVGITNMKNISKNTEWKLIKYHINLNKK